MSTIKALKTIAQAAKQLKGPTQYHMLGLLTDDMHRETDVVKEAVKRLPRDVREQREFRLLVACQMSMKKEILPADKWTKLEQDIEYLQPYLDMVTKEQQAKKKWDDY